MAVTWGPYDGHLCVGYTLSRSTTTAAATLVPYIGTDGWDYDDDQTLHYVIEGVASSQTKHNSLSGGHAHHQGATREAQLAFTSKAITGTPGQTINVSITLSGSYIATETPTLSFSFKLADKPSAPTTPTVTGVAQSSATVNMTLPSSNYSPITDTRFRIYTAATGGTLVASYTSTTNATSHLFSGLTPGTTYYAEVDAVNALGDGPNSTRKSFTTTALVAPSKPAAPTVSAITDTTCTVTMTTPAANGSTITGYSLMVVDADENIAYFFLDTTLVRNVTGLVIGTDYHAFYKVASTGGDSEWSDPTPFSTTAAAPGAPTALAVSQVADDTQFAWGTTPTGGSPILQYGVEVFSDDTYTTSVFSELASASPHVAENGDLPFNVQLWWRVRAQNAIGWGPYTNGESFYLNTDGGIYYFPPEGGPPVRAYMYWFNEDGIPVLVM